MMSNRTIKDWLVIVGGFHFFMAILSVIAAAAIFIYAVLPTIDAQPPEIAQKLFIPVVGTIISLIVCGVYVLVGFGLIQLRNLARMISIFLAAFGILGGFIAAIGSIASNIIGEVSPDWMSILTVSSATICFYAIISFMNIFLLIFLFIPQVRLAFYGESLNVIADDSSESSDQPLQSETIIEEEEKSST